MNNLIPTDLFLLIFVVYKALTLNMSYIFGSLKQLVNDTDLNAHPVPSQSRQTVSSFGDMGMP